MVEYTFVLRVYHSRLGFQPILKFHSFWAVFTLSADKKTESAVLQAGYTSQNTVGNNGVRKIRLGTFGIFRWPEMGQNPKTESYFLHQTVLK